MNRFLTPLVFIATFGSAFAADNWTNLFNGKDIEGWVQRGGKAKYTIEDGSIVGTSTMDTPNSFLCTGRDYGDFILEYEFKVDPRLNSGVQIRSNSYPTATELEWQGKKYKTGANVVHGLQIEIDPNPKQNRWWAAGIYEEGRRGWLYPGILGGNGKEFTDQGRKIFKQEDWNKVRVEAIGDSIKTTLNGTPCAEIKDSVTPSGFIALQVHGIGKEKEKDGTQVRWRNLRIQEVEDKTVNTLTDEEKSAGWKLLWDGKTSDGWRSAKGPDFPKAGWKMDNGILTINETGGAESAAAGDIITKDKYSEFELSVDFKITAGANSGIKTFVDPSINKGEGSAIGPEFQILDDARHPDAKLGRDGNRTIGSLYDMKTAPADKKVNPVGQWNNARILAKGKQLTYWLNGVKTIDIERGGKEWRDLVAISKYKVWPNFGELPEGHILLQDHGNQVFYKNIKIRDLSK
ncbi:DUF1080 domain-containing protein [Luteolibacter yonseiensis]|uniref:DUF1080 domain-containing protein n=1 Tax=Luteolibacter yonseiensis TaxID=1144680 RepID=A0A934R6H5_9BACT|nr:DUF1080 domain-containing protein [Luteolibacter yonseiensis]MBK1816868.1 DUF1080 domain-containing protein [Luteolibacter yonseiensis]